MVGKHSPAKLAQRRERALNRGYFAAKPPGCSYVAVPSAVAPRVKEVAASLSLHSEHNQLVSTPSPFARQATRAARSALSEQAYKSAMKKHDVANLAKHRWNPSEAVPASPTAAHSHPVLGSSPPASGASPSSSGPPPPASGAPPSSSVKKEKFFDEEAGLHDDLGSHSLRADAPVFVPEQAPAPRDCCSVSCAGCGSSWSALFDVQNATIALLTGRLDLLLPAQRRLRDVEKKLPQLDSKINALAASLSTCVRDAVDKKCGEGFPEANCAAGGDPALLKAINRQIVDARLVSVDSLQDTLQGLTVKLIETLSTSLTASQTAATQTMMTSLKEYIDARTPGSPSGAAVAGSVEETLQQLRPLPRSPPPMPAQQPPRRKARDAPKPLFAKGFLSKSTKPLYPEGSESVKAPPSDEAIADLFLSAAVPENPCNDDSDATSSPLRGAREEIRVPSSSRRSANPKSTGPSEAVLDRLVAEANWESDS